MKDLLTTIFLFFSFFCLLTAQNIITVDNATGSIADYTSLQTAIDVAAPDDLIYVAGSSSSYGNVNISKKVQIIGPGYFLQYNYPGIPAGGDAKVGNVLLTAGASSSIISGLRFNYMSLTNISDVIIKGCYKADDLSISDFVDITDCSNVKFIQNFVWASNQTHALTINNGCSGIIIANNIFFEGKVDFGATSNTSNALIEHNIFVFGGCDLQNSTLRNNIFILSFPTNRFDSNTFTYNLSTYSSIDGPGNTYLPGGSSGIFTGYPDQGNYTYDSRYELAPGSPAMGAGQGGVDCGVFSGSDPYTLSGIPSIPLIYSVEGPSSAPAGGTIQVTIKAKTGQ
jgi:hypothetical protein